MNRSSTRRGLRAVGLLAVLLASSATLSAQTLEFYHLDALGSVRAVTNVAGVVVEQHDYLPFGGEVPPSGGVPQKFTGQERDPEIGLDYFGARYYSPRTGRFTTVDPALDVKKALEEPQRWNRYAYVLNNPYGHVDPDGAVPVTLLVAIVAMAQRVAVSPAGMQARQAIINLGMQAWMQLTRLFSSAGGQEVVREVAELATGYSSGAYFMAPGIRKHIGAMIGHHDAGYAKIGRELGVAVLDIPKEIWDRMPAEQMKNVHEAFLDGIVARRLTVGVAMGPGGPRERSWLGFEIDYLVKRGYTLVGNLMVPTR